MEIKDSITVQTALRGSLTLAELLLHASQLLLLFLDFLGEEDVFILQELYLSEKFIHLHSMLLTGVLKSSQSDIFAGYQVLHIFRRISLFFGGQVMVKVNFFDLRFFLLQFLPLLELFIREQASYTLISPGILLLDFLNQLLDLQIPSQFLCMVCYASCQFFPLCSHFLCQFEHTFFVTGISIAMRGRLAILLGYILIAFFKLVYLACESLDILIFLPNELLQGDQLLLLCPLNRPQLQALLALTQKLSSLGHFLLDLLLDAQTADRAQGIQFCLCFAEFSQL